MATFWQDVRYGLRILAKNPGFTAVAVLTLALGIGVNAAIFSLVDAAVLRPLPFPAPKQLLRVWEKPPKWALNSVAPLNYLDWQDQSRSFQSMAAFVNGHATLTGSDVPERIPSAQVSASFSELLGVTPEIGRGFAASEGRPGQDSVALISHGLWLRRFAGDRSVLGAVVVLDGKSYTIIGVLPRNMQLFGEADVWTPLALTRETARRDTHFLNVVARLKPGVSMDSADAEMQLIAGRIAKIAPATNQNWGVLLVPLQQSLIGPDVRRTSLVLFGAVGFVLLIACANVANLMLIRGAARSREIAVRLSLGAGPGRIARQSLTESLLLSALGAALGLWLAEMALATAPSWLPAGTLPPAVRLQLDARVIGFAILAAFMTGILCGLAPALRSARINLNDVLRASGYSSTGGHGPRRVLAVTEIAMAVVLVAGAALLLRTLMRLEQVDRGYRAENVLTFHVSLPPLDYPAPEKVVAFHKAATAELERLPGVRSVGFGTDLPLGGWSFGEGFDIAGRPPSPPGNRTFAHYQTISPGYFETLGISMSRGRAFSEQDTAASIPVCIINSEFALRFFSTQDPIGAHLNMGSAEFAVVREIVGVSGQVKIQGPAEPSGLEIYVPYTQDDSSSVAYALQTEGDPTRIASAAIAAIHSVNKDLPLTDIRTLDAVAAQSVARPRFRAVLIGAFAALALALAMLGIYGVLAYAVGQRIREFGIRMALGATPGNVLRLVLKDGLQIAIAGVALGVCAALALTHYLATMLYGVQPIDPATFVGVPALLILVALAACGLPARRATRVDPMVALHYE